MKTKLSESTVQLIRSLYAKRSFWETLVHPDPRHEIIQQIWDAGEPAAMLDLLPILLTANRELALACAKAIHQLLMQLKPVELVSFDEYVRRGYYYWDVLQPWHSIKPEDLAHFSLMGEASVSLLGIASCHRNGYIREEAIRKLANIETGEELPFLLLRANDWVASIRSSARDLLISRVRPNYVRHILSWLPLVIRLSKTSRDDQSWILNAVEPLLASPEARQMLYQGFESEDHIVRRFCFRIALRGSGSDLPTAMENAFKSRDPQVRRAAVQQLASALPNDELKSFLARARNDPWMPVRRESLHIYDQKYKEAAEREFHLALLDPNAAIREEAQYFLRRGGTLDLRAYYCQVLETVTDTRLCAAIAGLGEVGQPNDSSLLERFISDPTPKVRAAALRAVAKLNPNRHLEQFLGALDDPSAKVAREGFLALSKRANSVGGPRLWEIYSRCRYAHGKRSVLYLFARLTKWDSIAFLIQSLADEDRSTVELSKRYIARWSARYNRSFVTPNTNQLSRLRDVLRRCSLLISPETHRHFELLLDRF